MIGKLSWLNVRVQFPFREDVLVHDIFLEIIDEAFDERLDLPLLLVTHLAGFFWQNCRTSR